MSKQLAISSAFSVFATAAFALHVAAGGIEAPVAHGIAGAPIEIEAPALSQLPQFAALPVLAD